MGITLQPTVVRSPEQVYSTAPAAERGVSAARARRAANTLRARITQEMRPIGGTVPDTVWSQTGYLAAVPMACTNGGGWGVVVLVRISGQEPMAQAAARDRMDRIGFPDVPVIAKLTHL